MSLDDVLVARATCAGWCTSLASRISKLRVDLNRAVGEQCVIMPETLLLALTRLTSVTSINIVYSKKAQADVLSKVVAALGQQVG
jgi:hypothetical protein